jgi:integrase/recombinase XerD
VGVWLHFQTGEATGLATIYRRGRVYWVRFRANGHHVRRSAHTSNKTEAIAFLRRLLIEYATKARGDRPRHRYEDAVERFLSEATIKPGTRVAYRCCHTAFRPVAQDRYLDEIDRRVLGDFISRRKQAGMTDATIRRDLAFLSSLCTMAVRWGWLGTNPVTAFNKRALKASRPRTRFLTPAELDQLLTATADHIRPAIILALETGLRKEELFSLTLSGIDLMRREIRLDHTKSGIPRRVPLSDKAISTIKVLLGQPQRPSTPYLFAKADGSRFVDMKNGFVAACKRAGLTDFRWHDLRHTFASWFVQDGGDLYHLSRILGHATVQMTTRYGHLRTGDLHAELQRVAQNRTQEHKINSAAAISNPAFWPEKSGGE